jgi:hypothetical protein
MTRRLERVLSLLLLLCMPVILLSALRAEWRCVDAPWWCPEDMR